MDNKNILDVDVDYSGSEKPPIYVVSENKFAILSFVSFGIYTIWWMYKTWKYFKEKDNLDIHPALRAIFSVFFFHSLLEKIKTFALSHDIKDSYQSVLLFIVYLVLSFAGNLPDPYWLLSVLSFLPLMPAYSLFNKTILSSNEYNAIKQSGFNKRQWVILIVGLLWTVLIIVGMLTPETEYY